MGIKFDIRKSFDTLEWPFYCRLWGSLALVTRLSIGCMKYCFLPDSLLKQMAPSMASFKEIHCLYYCFVLQRTYSIGELICLFKRVTCTIFCPQGESVHLPMYSMQMISLYSIKQHERVGESNEFIVGLWRGLWIDVIMIMLLFYLEARLMWTKGIESRISLTFRR